MLKAQTAQSQVVLRVIQTLSEDSEEDTDAGNKDQLDHVDDPRDDTLNWTPLWTRWLGLPRWDLPLLRKISLFSLHWYSAHFTVEEFPLTLNLLLQ